MLKSNTNETLETRSHYREINDLVSLEHIDLAIGHIHQNYNLSFHPYTIWMKFSANRDGFRKSQLSFRYAVEEFACSLAACLAKIPSLEKRVDLAQNIAEEHGHGDIKQSHKYTFIEYLLALGASEYEIQIPITNGTYIFNQTLLNFINGNSYLAGSAALGIIEYLYIDISAEIAKTIIEKDWVKLNSQRHYAVHEKLDVQHAKELFDISRDEWSDSKSKKEILNGLVFGAECFTNLYHSMLPK